MKSWLWKGMLAATIALPALSGVARAQSHDDDGCTNATLKGDYAFSVIDFSVPQVVVGIKTFDGKGKFTQRDYGGDSLRTTGQTDFSTEGQETGTYKVNPDCTGSAEIHLNVPGVPPGTSHGVIKIAFAISGGGRAFHEVVAEFTPPGATQPVPTQTRADDWKVGSDDDGCTNATLQGDYAFVVTDFALPQVVAVVGKFDGKGKYTQVDYIGDSLRTMGATSFRGGETGSYTVNPDCTGSQEIKLNIPGVPPGTSHGVIENMFVISGAGRSIHAVIAELTPPGGTQPVPTQGRVDFWKVGSEQDN